MHTFALLSFFLFFFLLLFHHLYFLQHMVLTIINITHFYFWEFIYILSSVCKTFKESEICYLGSFLKIAYHLDGQSARCVKTFWRMMRRFVVKISSNSFIFQKMVRNSLWSVRHTSCNFTLVSVYFWRLVIMVNGRVNVTSPGHVTIYLPYIDSYTNCVLRLYLFIWLYYRNFLRGS